LLSEISPEIGLKRPNGTLHSIADLVWHMVNWRKFTIDRIKPSGSSLETFEKNDWKELDLTNKSTWVEGLNELQKSQHDLIELLDTLDDSILKSPVPDREYNMKILLYGVVQHDIYHAGQIAYIKKLFD
jgi:uncharacterized damage-inducible protein DinB